MRDHAWACFSPPLLHSAQLGAGPGVENCGLTLTPARAARLCHLDREPGPLLAHLAARHRNRLGIYFETLWHFFLESDPDTDLLAHNLAVREDGKTLGEFDILYLCKPRQRHIHLELAVKFYLGVPGSNTWLGPGEQDRLDQKVVHLTQRQIRLGEQEPSRESLRALGITRLYKQIEVKGYLFAPTSDSPPPPRGYNRDAPFSRWYRIDEFQALATPAPEEPGWQLLERKHWISPLLATATPATSHSTLLVELQAAFNAGSGPLLLARCDARGRETQRCFVTPQHWPRNAAGASQKSVEHL